MRKFITLYGGLKHYFPDTVGFEMVKSVGGQAIMLSHYETVIFVCVMGDQGGTYHWHVTLSMIDGPIVSKSGNFSWRGVDAQQEAENAINSVLGEMTKSWLPQFLPAEQ